MSAEVEKQIKGVGVGSTDSEEFLLVSAENLKTGIMYAVSHPNSGRTSQLSHPQKQRWLK